MLAENESVLGLDISQDNIKIVELKKTAEGMELIRAKVLPLPAVSPQKGVSAKPESVAAVLREFIHANNILTRKAVGVLGSSSVLTRLLRIPFMSEDEIKSILESEISHYANFKNKEKIIDFCLLDEINEEGIKKVNVVFAVALKDTIDSFAQVAEQANLELIGIDAATLSMIRALENVNIRPQHLEPSMLIIIDKDDIQLCILKGNRLRFLHTVKIDIKDFVSDREEFLDRMLLSVKLVLNYYSKSAYGQEDISRVIIKINEPLAKDIERGLTERLTELTIEKPDPLGRIKIDNTAFPEEEKENISLLFAPVIGAVLRVEDSIDYPLNLNLIPLTKQQKMLIKKELGLYVSALTVILAVFMALGSLLWINTQLIEMKISNADKEIRKIILSLNKFLGERSDTTNIKDRIKQAEQINQEVNKDKLTTGSNFLAEIMVAVPDGLWLSDISAEEKDALIFLSGSAISEKSVFDYVNILTAMGYFSTLQPMSSQGEEANLTFSIRCQLKK